MERTFTLLLSLAVILNLFTGLGIYWLSETEIQKSGQDATIAAVNGIASSLGSQIDLLTRSLDKMAENPEVIATVDKGTPVQLKKTASSLLNYLPDIMKLRLLRPETSVLEKQEIPHLGYADLDLVRETFTANQPPMIQGLNGPNRHLAIARRILKDGRAIGVILASMNYDFLKKSVTAAGLHQGLVQLKQDTLTISASGNNALENESESDQIIIAGTNWSLQYWFPVRSELSNIYLLSGIFLISVLLMCLAFFLTFRNINEMLHHDQRSVLKAVKDLLTGKFRGEYPVKLNEMRSIISTVVQFKRVLDNERNHSPSGEEEKPSLDHFFQYSMDEPENDPADHTVRETGTPVALPEIIAPLPEGAANFGMNHSSYDIRDKHAAIFRAYDIRGIAGKALTKEVVYDIGRALGSEAQEKSCKTVIMARDGRISSPALCGSLAQGILSTGRDVIDLGMVPTPLLYFVTHHHEDHTGVMITGSHNPADYNGLKMVVDGETLAGERIQMLKQRIDKGQFVAGKKGKLESITSYVNEYIGTITDDVHLSRPMKIVLDCGNGVTGELGPILLRTMGCEVIELFCEIDGNFPNHHPDPSQPENLSDLITAVQHYQADLGIAFDGDGDRLGIVDSHGKIIWPDRQMMLFSKDVLKSHPGAEIIYDIKSSRHLEDQIVKYGGHPLMWKTGHSFMKAKIRETGAKLAGEMSGHIFFNDRWFGFDDALYSAARIIEILSADTRTSSEIFADFPDSINTPELNIELPEGENFRFMEQLLSTADFAEGKISNLDGIRVDFPSGWGLVRASNTTPALVVRFEADSKENLAIIQDQFKQQMTQIKPDLSFPF